MHERDLVPFAASRFAGGQRVLVLAPHPDDEVLGCGGALLQHVDAGDPVEVLFLTSGELGDWQGAGPDAVAARREEEARRSLALLGAAPPRFWRMPDRGLVADGALARRIHDVVRELRATLVYAPSPLDLHPDHRATAHALARALAAASEAPEVALYETSHPLPPTHLVDVSAELERKWAALACYGSQADGAPPYREAARGIGAYRALTLGPEVRSAEAYRRVPGARLGDDLSFRWAALQAAPGTGPRAEGPAISVIVRTVDRPALLRRALASLAQQTRRDFEVVLVNDGGPPLDALLAEFPELDIVPVVHAEARGRAAATNAGVRASRAPLLAFLDDDDLYYPPHLEQLGRLLDEHPHLEGAYSDAEVVLWQIGGDGGRQLGYRGTLWSTDFDPERLLHENTIPNLCLMLRRSLWERLGGVDERFDLYEDWDLLIRLSREARLAHLPNVTAVYELRQDGSGSAQQGGERARAEEAARARIEELHGALRDPRLTERYAELARTSPRRRLEAADPWEPLPPAPADPAVAGAARPAPVLPVAGEARGPTRLAIVIVHYRTGSLTARAVDSLLADAHAAGVTDEALELVVVDNGSDADDARALDALPARVLRPGRNLGYAGGVNLGVARTRAERILVANPDLVARPGLIATLLAELDARGGIVGPRFAWDDAGRWMLPPLEPRALAAETLRLLALRGGAFASLARRRYRRRLMRFFRATAPLATTDLSGALLAFTREAWHRVGPMDEGYALYFEDAAWMESARRAGVPCRQLPGAVAVHRFHSSAAREPRALGWFHASRARFRRAHHGELAARFLEWLELRLGARAEPAPPAPSGAPPSLALPPPGARPAGLVAELSLEPLGIPATVAEVPSDAGERVVVPEECWEHAPPGCYRLSLLDGRGRELAATRATRAAPDASSTRRSSVSASVEAPISVARFRDMIAGPVDGRPLVVELRAGSATEQAEALAARLGGDDVARVVVPSRAHFGLVPPPEETDLRRVVAALCEAGLEIRSERALLGADGAPLARLLVVRPSGFRVRGLEEGDAEPILDLFRRVFGVERTHAHLAWKYLANPFGAGRISMAFAPDGALAAHYAGYPQPYVHFPADGGAAEPLTGLQVGDTMTDPAHRDVGSGATKLLARTTRHFFGTHRTGEIGFYFGFNRGGIQRFSARVIGGHIVEDVPFRRAPAAPLCDAGAASAIAVVDLRAGQGLERLDAFFRRVGPAHGLTARRDAAWLDWRYLRHPDQRYTVLATGGATGLIGWAVFRREGERLLMGDALLDPERPEEAARALLAGALERAGEGVTRVEGWFPSRPAFLDEMLPRIGFERAPHPDELAMLMLLERIDSIELVRERLYYTMGDGDLF